MRMGGRTISFRLWKTFKPAETPSADSPRPTKNCEAAKHAIARYSRQVTDLISITRVSDGVYIDVNQAVRDILGYDREELIRRILRTNSTSGWILTSVGNLSNCCVAIRDAEIGSSHSDERMATILSVSRLGVDHGGRRRSLHRLLPRGISPGQKRPRNKSTILPSMTL